MLFQGTKTILILAFIIMTAYNYKYEGMYSETEMCTHQNARPNYR